MAALVRLLAAVDIAAPAVRTAISRMVRQGWLEPIRTAEGPGYALTPRADRRLDDAHTRIYRTEVPAWDGRWHVLVLERPGERSARERLAAGLGYLGYAALTPTTWLSPRAHPDAPSVVAAEGARASTFRGAYDGDGAALAARAWDLGAVAAAYDAFEIEAARLLGDRRAEGDRAAFATRSALVHEWRKFLFLDPGLPPEVLPPQWPGARAARLFAEAAGDLLPAADRYVDACLRGATPARNLAAKERT